MNEELKMFVWKETLTNSGSRWGGTIVCQAKSVDDARKKIIQKACLKPKELFGDGFERIGIDNLLKDIQDDLAHEPKEMDIVIVDGGDY